MEDLTKKDRLRLIRECWDEFSKHSAPSLTSRGASQVDDLLREFESLYEE